MTIHVSDHALLRYIERVQGISLEDLRQKIAEIVIVPAKAGASTVTVDGFTYCFVERRSGDVVVTTILFNEMRAKQRVKNKRKPYEVR